MNYRCVLWIIDVSSELQVCATDYRCLMQITDVCCRLEKGAVDYRYVLPCLTFILVLGRQPQVLLLSW